MGSLEMGNGNYDTLLMKGCDEKGSEFGSCGRILPGHSLPPCRCTLFKLIGVNELDGEGGGGGGGGNCNIFSRSS